MPGLMTSYRNWLDRRTGGYVANVPYGAAARGVTAPMPLRFRGGAASAIPAGALHYSPYVDAMLKQRMAQQAADEELRRQLELEAAQTQAKLITQGQAGAIEGALAGQRYGFYGRENQLDRALKQAMATQEQAFRGRESALEHQRRIDYMKKTSEQQYRLQRDAQIGNALTSLRKLRGRLDKDATGRLKTAESLIQKIDDEYNKGHYTFEERLALRERVGGLLESYDWQGHVAPMGQLPGDVFTDKNTGLLMMKGMEPGEATPLGFASPEDMQKNLSLTTKETADGILMYNAQRGHWEWQSKPRALLNMSTSGGLTPSNLLSVEKQVRSSLTKTTRDEYGQEHEVPADELDVKAGVANWLKTYGYATTPQQTITDQDYKTRLNRLLGSVNQYRLSRGLSRITDPAQALRFNRMELQQGQGVEEPQWLSPYVDQTLQRADEIMPGGKRWPELKSLLEGYLSAIDRATGSTETSPAQAFGWNRQSRAVPEPEGLKPYIDMVLNGQISQSLLSRPTVGAPARRSVVRPTRPSVPAARFPAPLPRPVPPAQQPAMPPAARAPLVPSPVPRAQPPGRVGLAPRPTSQGPAWAGTAGAGSFGAGAVAEPPRPTTPITPAPPTAPKAAAPKRQETPRITPEEQKRLIPSDAPPNVVSAVAIIRQMQQKYGENVTPSEIEDRRDRLIFNEALRQLREYTHGTEQ